METIKRSLICKILLCFFCVLLICPLAFASVEVGKISYTEGRVDVLRADSGNIVPLRENEPIFVGDIVRTKSNSKSEISFYDKSIIQLAQNTRLEIKDYRLGENNKRESAAILVQRGKVRTIIEKYEGVEPFAINTPNAKGTIKGSDIFAFYQGGTSGMLVNSGNLAVINLAEPELPPVMIPPGNSVVISLEEQPQGPRPYLEIEKKFHEQDTTPPPSISRRKDLGKISGAITKFYGDVRITKEGTINPRVSQINDVLSEGDIIETGIDGMIEIKFDNSNAINMKPNSRLVISRLIVDSTNGEFENSFELSMGKVRATVENLKGDSSFQIKTPVATCGVRGTIMVVETTKEETKTFFEGGFGFIRSLLSGLEQKVGIGENSTADNKGNVSIPKFTTQKERMEMGGGWEPGSGIEGYSAPEGTTGTYLYDADTGINKSDSESEDLIGNTKDAGNTSDNILDSLTPDPEPSPEPLPEPEPSPEPPNQDVSFNGTFFAGFVSPDMEWQQDGYVDGSLSSNEDFSKIILRGTFAPPVEGNDELWIADGFSGTDDSGTAYIGMIAGTKEDDLLDAFLYSLYIREDDAGDRYAGYVFSNDISGVFDPGVEQGTFDGEGNLVFGFEYPTSVSPSELYIGTDAVVEHRNIEADIIGDITGAYSVSIDTARIADQSWDIWSFGAEGTFSTLPLDDWEAVLGSATYGEFSASYLLWKINGSPTSYNKLQGTISGKNLYVDMSGDSSLGVLMIDNGDFIGTLGDGTWYGIGAGIGSAEQALQLGGYFNGQFAEFGEGLGNESGSIDAIMGTTASIWDGTTSILVMGEYSNPADQNLWTDNGNFEAITQDGSRLLGVIGGISNNGSAQAGLLAFYIRPDDVGFRAGYLMSNDLSGNFYNDLGMFELDGSLNYYQDFPTMYSPEDLESALDDNIEIYGDIVGGSGFYGGLSLDATNIKDQNWGLFYGGAGGSLITPLGDGWQISMNGVGFEPDSNIIDSYIMGQMTGDGWSNNEFSGIFSGQYISINSLGIFSGDILGVYDQSQESWEALMLGSSSEIEQLTSSGGLMATVRDHDMNADLLEGLIGLRDNIWDGGASFVSMGKAEFWVRGTDDFIWYGAPQSFYSYDPYGDDGSGRYSTFEDEQNDNQYGSLVGLSVGRTNDGFMEGILYSIYVDPEGNFGVASDNNLLGMYDNETEMYLLEGYLGLSTPKSGYPLAPEDLYTNLSFSDVTGNPEVGGFTIGGDINLEEFSSSLVSLYNLDWGIFELHGAGTYADNISDSWTVDGMTGMTSDVDTYRLGGSWLGSMAGSIWSENRIDGQLDAVWIQLRRDGTLSGHTITASEVLGNYVEIESESGTFQVASAGEWVEVDSLLDLAGQYDDITNLAGPNIPITEVYTSLLSGSGMFESGGSLNIVSMNMDFYVNDDFYNFISNGIWAAKIDGTFTNPVGMAWTANVTGNLRNTMTEGIDGTVSATFSGTDFDNGHWQADVIGSTSTDITFQGVAGGTIDSGLLTFTGAGTGTYQTP